MPRKFIGHRAFKGRGALSNPRGRFEKEEREPVDDGWWRDEEPVSIAQTVEPDRARSVITTNNSPDVGFDYSINPYRGCEHGCVYCLDGETRVLMASGHTKALADIEVGDEIFGTRRSGVYRRYVRTRVLAHWRTLKPSYLIRLEDGTELTASGDHRFLSDRGWKFVTGAEHGRDRRPFLTLSDKLLGFGAVLPEKSPCQGADYRRGYLCGVIRGNGHRGVHRYQRAGRSHGDADSFRLAMTDSEALDRASLYLGEFGVSTTRFLVQARTENRQHCEAIRPSARASIETVQRLIQWPDRPVLGWLQGFIAGVFDAEGSYSRDGILRIADGDTTMMQSTKSALNHLGFDVAVETISGSRPCPMRYVRLRGGLREHLRLFRTCQPAITRKCDIGGTAVKLRSNLNVVSIERMARPRELFDITTGTGDFLANGVISHNCFARPSHAYIGLSPGLDFETKLFYKENAANLLEQELAHPRYVPKPIALGINTDGYQPVEKRLEVTRSILAVLARCRHPVTLVTKSALILRDMDLLADMARDNLVSVTLSVTSLQPEIKRTLEPRTASPQARLRVIRELSAAGVPTGVLIAPVIPAITDHEMEGILQAAKEAGALSAGYVLLRLPWEVKDLFREWLAEHYPDRARHVMSLINQARGGRDNDPNFGSRMRGTGPYAELLRARFEVATRKLGLNSADARVELDTGLFRPPRPQTSQLTLGFD
jgi:DNA repair photolyase